MSAQTKHRHREQGATDPFRADMPRIGNTTVQMERPLLSYLHSKFTPWFSIECLFHASTPALITGFWTLPVWRLIAAQWRCGQRLSNGFSPQLTCQVLKI